jgi:hypothetical protein
MQTTVAIQHKAVQGGGGDKKFQLADAVFKAEFIKIFVDLQNALGTEAYRDER